MSKENKKLKVAFPHMGTVYIAWSAALKKIGAEPFVPPYTSKKLCHWGLSILPKQSVCLTNLFWVILLKQLKAEQIMLR